MRMFITHGISRSNGCNVGLLHALHRSLWLAGRGNRSRQAVGFFQDNDRLFCRVGRRNDACGFEFTVDGRNGSIDLFMTCAFRERCTG
ncbi:hypothetical protein AT6N2_C0644 [Agrobacterium tumefaciens]|nr:hypothetical protein AT6N2_C0644 [Agrobacterium tumefaciens]